MPYPQNVDPGIGIIYFNVRDYGATGDGSTDDYAAIQNCVDVSTDDSIIYFPPGLFLTSTEILIPGKRTLLGTNSSTVKMKDNSDLVAVLASQDWFANSTSSGNPIVISNLSVDANSSNNAQGHGIILMNYNAVVRACTIDNCIDHGVMISSLNQSGASISNTCVENRIELCKISNCLGHGIYGRDTNGKLIDGYIDSCIVNNTSLDAIRSERGTGFFFSQNYCYENQAGGISVGNCYNTFIIDNKIDDYGQDVSGSGFIAGIDATIIGPRPSVITGNIVSTTEPAANYHYQDLAVTFGGLTETRCFVHGNVIRGGWDTNPNNPSDPAYSQAIAYQVNATQTGGGQPAYLIASHNSYDNTGNGVFLDSYITPSAVEHVGDIQLDRHLTAANAILDEPALAALSANGTTPPDPTFTSLGGTDVRGKVNFGSGGSPSSGEQVEVTFTKAYTDPPAVVITAQNAATAALGLYASSVTGNGFNIAAQNAPSASQGGSTYTAVFIVIG